MTIAVGVACPEGLVLAADSRTSYVGAKGMRIATDHAHKVFELGTEGRYAAATYGWAYLSGAPIAGHMEQFAATEKYPSNIEEAAEHLHKYFGDRLAEHLASGGDGYPAAGVDVLGFLAAGYNEHGVGQLVEIGLPASGIVHRLSTLSPGFVWRGQFDVITRLVKGWDGSRLDVSNWGNPKRTSLANLELLVPTEGFALQDAVDFAAFVVRTTVDMQRFSNGTRGDPGAMPACGGPTNIAALTQRDGLRWPQRSELQGVSSYGRGEGFHAE